MTCGKGAASTADEILAEGEYTVDGVAEAASTADGVVAEAVSTANKVLAKASSKTDEIVSRLHMQQTGGG